MQISDMLGQYSRNITNGTEELRGAQSVQKIVSTLNDLSAGSIFEGTVNHIRNGKVTLALGNGQLIAARLDAKVNLQPGVSMFFQVKSNDGMTVSIRPYNGMGNAGNPILLNALTAAGIPVSEKTLAMVDAMMKEQMPIGKNSILEMVKVLSGNPNVNVEALVKMTKLGIPTTKEMTAQFQNYMADRHAILNAMDTAVSQIADAIADEALPAKDAFSLYSRIVDILQGDGEHIPQMQGADRGQTDIPAEPAGNKEARPFSFLPLEEQVRDGGEPGRMGVVKDLIAEGVKDGAMQAADGTVKNDNAGGTGLEQLSKQAANAGGAQPGSAASAQMKLGQLFSEEQLAKLAKQLEKVPLLSGSAELFPAAEEEEVFVDTMTEDAAEEAVTKDPQLQKKAVLDSEMPLQKFLSVIKDTFSENDMGFTGLKKLLSSREFKDVLRGAFSEQWTIKPEELTEENKINKLYAKLEQQMRQIESAMKQAGVTSNQFAQTASDIRGNVEFMNQVNQIYAYVQIPLQMTGQKANGELYVYTNKKRMRDPDAELSAFLHLDLDYLGSTDVSIKMQKRNVVTKFYLADDATFGLIEKHLPILEKRLKKKGYHCSVSLENNGKKINFVEDFLSREQPSMGALHRYSFDVKA